ncbi:MAG: hypothetical protein ACK41E_02160 [Deinococcales bacterium]
MRSPVAAWFMGLLWLGLGCAAIYTFSDLPLRLLLACLMVFLVDAFGGRWFGYTSIPFITVGLLNDPKETWILLLPLIVGSFWAGLFLRHAEPGWLGVPLGIIGFTLPVAALITLRGRVDPMLQLPLQNQFLYFYVGAGIAAIFCSSILIQILRRQARLKPARRPKQAVR